MDKSKKKSKSKGDTWTEKELEGATGRSGSTREHVAKGTSKGKAGEPKTALSPAKKAVKQDEKKRSDTKGSPASSRKQLPRDQSSERRPHLKGSTDSPKTTSRGGDSTPKKKAHSRTDPAPSQYLGSPSASGVASSKKPSSTSKKKDYVESEKKAGKDRGKDAKKEKTKDDDRRRDKKDKEGAAEKLKASEEEKSKKVKKEKKGEEKEDRSKAKTHRGGDEAEEEPKQKGKDKEEKKTKTKHEDRDSRSGHKKTRKVEVLEEPPPPVQEPSDIEEEYEYEEDFDEYDEDFESSEPSPSVTTTTLTSPFKPRVSLTSPTLRRKRSNSQEMGADLTDLLQALDQENQQITQSRDNSAGVAHEEDEDEEEEEEEDEESSSDTEVRSKTSKKDSSATTVAKLKTESSTFRRIMDFAYAQKHEVNKLVSKKAKKRGQELLSLIELDIVEFTLFDLPPLSEYELYVKKFGSDTSRQIAVQTGEDNLEQDSQTDPIPMSNVWVQWPPTDFKGYGREDLDGREERDAARVTKEDSIKLAAFLKKAGQVCSILLEENLASQNKAESQSQSPFSFCTDQFLFQNTPALLKGWCMTEAQFSMCKDQLIVASYSKLTYNDSRNDPTLMGVVCIWNSRALFGPNMVLICHSPTTCCCFSPLKSTLAFAGCVDGSVVLWDLREPASLHEPLNPEAKFMGRYPTFSTAGISQLSNHQSPILWIGVLSIGDLSQSSSSSKLTQGMADPDLITGGDTSGSGLSFQLATLDQTGILKLWVVVELTSGDPFGSDSDLGLMPGGRVKLVKSVTIDLSSLPGQSKLSCDIHSIQFHPRDTNHIYVGTGAGFVTHHTRYGQRAIPSTYYPRDSALGSIDVLAGVNACGVTNISFCLQQPDHFLVGCSDGSIRLHHIKRALPLHCIPTSTGGVAIKTIQWVEHCPGLVLVVDYASKLYMWDLIENDAQPMFTKQLEYNISCCKLSLPALGSVSLLLAYEEGMVELHSLKPLPQELSERQQLLTNYFIGLL